MATEPDRTCTLTLEEQKDFDPVAFTSKLKASGFRLDSETCPVKIALWWDTVSGDDGSLIWRQWDVP